jgi:putative long chain acyl-CoA synthase
VLAVDASIDAARAETGRDVHLSGYSQGGMFCYQAAAYRRSAGLASVVTFGSPVDVRKVLPVPVADPLIDRVLRWVRAGIDAPLEGLEGLPGAITSTGFKVFSARKEVEQVATFFRLLHDREALARREPERRFLGGEGFVAWPGPAFKDFVDQLVVENRLTRGGLMIAGRAVSLADLTVPVLSFVGTKDEMARPPSVRAIRKAAPRAEHHEVTVPAGHFGLVVGSRSLSITWPTVAEWMAWRDADGPKPARLDAAAAAPLEEADGDAESMYELAVQAVDGVWDRLGEASVEAAGLFHALRWELPRLARLESLCEGEQVGLGRTLRQQAQALGDRPFLLWEGRATSWAQADARVDRAVDALVRDGVTAGAEVVLPMGAHPDHLAALLAVNRLGAVAVVTAPGEGAVGVDAPALLRRRPPGPDPLL